MNCVYIKENGKKYSLFKTLWMKLYVEEHQGLHLLTIPKCKRTKDYIKLCKKMKQAGIQSVCYDKIEDDILLSYLKKEFDNISGETLFYHLFYDILNFAVKKKNMKTEEIHLVFITNRPDVAEAYIDNIYKKVGRISVFTTRSDLFFYLTEKNREEYGIFLDIKGKEDKLKKYKHIYINLDHNRYFKEDFFKGCYMIDIFRVYKGAFREIVLQYRAEADDWIQKKQIIKNLSFTEFLEKKDENLDRKNYKIVKIDKI